MQSLSALNIHIHVKSEIMFRFVQSIALVEIFSKLFKFYVDDIHKCVKFRFLSLPFFRQRTTIKKRPSIKNVRKPATREITLIHKSAYYIEKSCRTGMTIKSNSLTLDTCCTLSSKSILSQKQHQRFHNTTRNNIDLVSSESLSHRSLSCFIVQQYLILVKTTITQMIKCLINMMCSYWT